ncbi:MAG TPA: iron-sulfur cluster assembly accessory protein [Flavobacteriaceae bacterium]|nr:iron-sulfur cluster assembly accessory protein [Flavobacteriaceae bacterium]HEX5742328.1 iron-sulfur cluster assembly accessory protein [Flavobacteriaceae bacterium]
MINISEIARKKIIDMMREEGKDPSSYYVRVGVQSGGCSGLLYNLSFDNQQNEGDKIVEDNGIKIIINKKSFLYIVGTTLDFSGGLNGKGLYFNNPNANRTCGCGESFSM